MKRRLIAWAMRRYPVAWRQRYGDEFAATIEQMPSPGWAAVWDISLGALRMQTQRNLNVKQFAALFGALGLAIAWGVSWRIPDLYLAQSTIRATGLDAPSLQQSVRRVLSRTRLQTLIQDHKLYQQERTSQPIDDVIEKMARQISVTKVTGEHPDRDLFRLGFAYPDAAASQRVTNALTNALIREYAPNAAATATPRFLSVDIASRPDPIYPNRPVMAVAGLLAGTVLGTACGLCKRRKV